MSDYTIGITLDISDNTTDTNSDWGLDSGVFYWITGRPGYAGSGYSGDAPASKTWKEGIITAQNQIEPVIRIIDITTGGSYGSLSGFSFEIDNTSKFWNLLESNSYYFVNRAVNVYVFLSDVSYQVWGGVVSEVDFNETSYTFKCEDKFKTIHKNIPQEVLTKESFPDITPDSEGKTIPVCIGDINRAELTSVEGRSKPIDLGQINGNTIYSTVIRGETISAGDNPKYTIAVPNKIIWSGEFATGDYFLRVIKGDEQTVRILNNATSSNVSDPDDITTVTLELENLLDNFVFAEDGAPVGGTQTNDTWYCQIVKGSVVHLFSNSEIDSFVKTGNDIGLVYWDKDADEYVNAPELIKSTDTTSSNDYGHPNMLISPRDLNLSGDFKRLVSVVPDKIVYNTAYTLDITLNRAYEITLNEFSGQNINTNLLDKDRTTGYTLTTSPTLSGLYLVLDVYFQDIIIQDMDELYLVIDGKYTAPQTYTLVFEAWPVDYWGNRFDQKAFKFIKADYPKVDDEQDFIPDYYYNPSGDLDGRSSRFHEIVNSSLQFKDYFKIGAGENADETKSWSANDINDIKSISHFELLIVLDGLASGSRSIEINQVGFVAAKKMNLVKDRFFNKIKGEVVSGTQSNTPKKAFEHILESYDGISSSDIDYGNLTSSTANTFKVGRQLNDIKKSNVYLRNLAEQTYIGIFPTREGKRGFSYWRDNDTPTVTHDESTILNGMIKKFDKTLISKTYNDLEVKFSESPAENDFDKSLFVSKISETSFPAAFESTGTDVSVAPTAALTSVTIRNYAMNGIDLVAEIVFGSNPSAWFTAGEYCSFDGGNGIIFYFGVIKFVDDSIDTVYVDIKNNTGLAGGQFTATGTVYANGTNIPDWSTYVGGISDYVTAKKWWDICNESYQRTLYVNKLPDNLSKGTWLPENENFEEGTGGSGNTAYKLLQNHVEWTSRQKEIVDYSVPINAANMALELLSPVTFSDAIYTNNTERLGWIQRIKYDFDEKLIDIQLILNPTDIITDNVIIETGSAPDTYTESGSAPDTITEGQ